jgi:hypothetical protein
VVVVKIRLWWNHDFGPRASRLIFQPPALRVPIVLGCRPSMSADIKNKKSFLVSADLTSRYKNIHIFLYRQIKSTDTKMSPYFLYQLHLSVHTKNK